jgi:hypothetical protein
MTSLSTHDLGPDLLDELAQIRNDRTPASFADKFRAACEAEAAANGGWINPNLVRARLLDEPDYEPRSYSAQWSAPWLTKTDHPVQIKGDGSRGNTNKSTFWRRLTADVVGGAA